MPARPAVVRDQRLVPVHPGLRRARGSSPHLVHLRRGHHRPGAGGPPDQLPAHHLRRPPRAGEGHQRRSSRSPGPRPHRSTSSSTCTASGPSTTPSCGGPPPAGCSNSTRPTARSPPCATSPRRRLSSRGWPRWGRCSTPPRCCCRRRTSAPRRRLDDEIKGPMMALAYGMPTLVEHRPVRRAAHRPPVTADGPAGPILRAGPGHLHRSGRVHRRPRPPPSAPPRPRGRTGAVLDPVRLDPVGVRPGPAGLAGLTEARRPSGPPTGRPSWGGPVCCATGPSTSTGRSIGPG